MNPNLPILLTFELQTKQITALRILCIRNGVQLIKADPAMYGETIGVLCGLDEASGAAADGVLSEPMLLFANMTMGAVQKFLNEAKAAKFSRPSLMAMLTDTNRTWTPVQLQAQLAVCENSLERMQGEQTQFTALEKAAQQQENSLTNVLRAIDMKSGSRQQALQKQEQQEQFMDRYKLER